MHAAQRERTLRVSRQDVSCFALQSRAPLKGVLTGVALSVEVDLLKFGVTQTWRRGARDCEDPVCPSEF